MGGVAVLTLILSMVRTKFAAILIGTAGVGISSNFTAIQGVVGAIAGLGIQSSAVRDIATAVAKNNNEEIGRTVLSLRRICWITGCFGMLTMVLMSPFLSQWTFGSARYRWDIGALGIVILLANIQGGQMALIQGMRRMGDLARVQLVGALIGTLVTIGFYFWLGVRGIVPALVFMASFQLLISWRVAKKIEVPVVNMSWKESFCQASGMVRLGVAMMWTGLLGSAVTYATNAMITQQVNLQAVGIYSAAFALSGVFVNFVLNAMGADYYPRLSGLAHDRVAINRLVNEQTEIGLLLAAPGLMVTIALAPLAIHIFYTQEFLPAANLLQWLALGCLGRVISWPLGFVMLALNKGKLFFIAETCGQFLNLLLIFLGLLIFGLEGISIAFCILYIAYTATVLYITKNLTDFCWSSSSKYLLRCVCALVVATFCAGRFLPALPGAGIGLLLALFGLIISMRGLLKRLGDSHRFVKILLRIPGMQSLNNIHFRFF